MADLPDVMECERSLSCPVCGSEATGGPRYEALGDRLFGAWGSWNVAECPDPGCGTLWLDPRPTRAEIGKAYRRYYTHGGGSLAAKATYRTIRALAREYANVRYGFRSGRLPAPARWAAVGLARLYPGLSEHLDLLVRHLPAAAFGAGRLLDVGCGDGQALEILSDLGWRTTGVEVDPGAVAAARAKGLDVRAGTLEEAALAEGSFDAVTSSHVIEHVHDPAGLLAACRRLLAPGGTLVFVTPNARAALHGRWGRDWMPLDPPRHLALFTAPSLRRLAESAGLQVREVRTTARMTALSEIASSAIRSRGRYEWGAWPGLGTWLRAQASQARESRSVREGRSEGEELVLVAGR